MKTPEEEAAMQAQAAPVDAAQSDTPRGRAAMLAKYKAMNPETADDPDDDSLFDFGSKGWGERDEYEQKYSSINGANERLAGIIGEDPRFAQFISMVAQGENLMYALGKTFGNMLDELDDESLESMRKGQEEYSAKFKKVKQNFDDYEKNLQAFASQQGLTPDDIADLDNRIMDIAEAFMDREIPMEMLELIWKGADYDNAKETDLEAAKLAAKNEVIEDVKSKKRATGPTPDISRTSASKPVPPPASATKFKSFAEAFTPKED